MHWLMLRGLVREQRHWLEFPDQFKAQVKDAHVHTLDAAGLGTEFKRQSPLSIDGITQDYRRRWLDLKAQHPGEWGILCASLGGMVGMHWCATFPQDFARMVLISSSAGNFNPFYERLKLRALGRVVRIAATQDLVKREERILRMVSGRPERIPETAKQWASFQLDTPTAVPTALNQLVAALRFSAPERLPVPTLVLSSKGDAMVSHKCSEAIARRYALPLKLHENAGHDLPLDDGTWVAARVAEWVTNA